jgi:hypothetical protein
MLFKKMLRYVLTTYEAGARRPAIKCKFVVTNLLTSTNDNKSSNFEPRVSHSTEQSTLHKHVQQPSISICFFGIRVFVYFNEPSVNC